MKRKNFALMLCTLVCAASFSVSALANMPQDAQMTKMQTMSSESNAFLTQESAKMAFAKHFNVPLESLTFRPIQMKSHAVKAEALKEGAPISEGRHRHMSKYLENVPQSMTPELISQVPQKFYKISAQDMQYQYEATLDAKTGNVLKSSKKALM